MLKVRHLIINLCHATGPAMNYCYTYLFLGTHLRLKSCLYQTWQQFNYCIFIAVFGNVFICIYWIIHLLCHAAATPLANTLNGMVSSHYN